MLSLARGRAVIRTEVRRPHRSVPAEAAEARLGGRVSLIVAVLTTMLLAAAARADGVVPMTLNALSDYAGQVIAGEAVSVRSYWAENPRRIESEVVFQNVEYLKGRLPDSKATFSLIVPGGTVGDWQMQIGCAPKFAVGERWVLFLLPTCKTFPVVGLHQGAFRIESDAAGVARVFDASGGAVISLGKDGFFQIATRSADSSSLQKTKDRGISGGPVSTPGKGATTAVEEQAPAQQDGFLAADKVRVRIVGRSPASPQAMSYDAFVATIRPVLERSKTHHLTSPAGQRDRSPMVPVPTRRAVLPGSDSEASPREADLRSGSAWPRKVEAPPPPARAQQPDADEKAKEVR
jgi:hypothetical protein